MRPHNLFRSAQSLAVMLGMVALAAASIATADPPSRVARLSFADGNVSFSPAGEDRWVNAVVNRPVITGDRLWADSGARVEVTLNNAALRLGEETDLAVLNLDDRMQQWQLTRGVLLLRVRRLDQGEVIEVDTPNLAFVVSRPGSYRFEVDPQGEATLVAVRSGAGDVYGEGNAYRIAAGQVLRFYGTDLRDQEYLALAPPDALERWAESRVQRFERAIATRYVSPDVIGYEELDSYGTWQVVGQYGNVWTPRNVPTGWAPYRDGHWAWIDPWGWTWVDDQPWGFAPSHYGRWAYASDRWFWVPGPVRARPVYAPALVAFIGGENFSVSIGTGGGIGWFPLAPGEVYRPAYRVSRDYFTRVNVTNTVINNTYITNIYNNPQAVSEVRYANRARPAAITAVPESVFVQARPVGRSAIAVSPQILDKAQVTHLAKIAPQRASFAGAAPEANTRPPRAALEQRVVAKTPPAPQQPSVEARLPQLNAAPGVPIERPAARPRASRAEPSRDAPGTVQGQPQRVRVVEAQRPTPARAVTTAPEGRTRAARERDASRAAAARAPGAQDAARDVTRGRAGPVPNVAEQPQQGARDEQQRAQQAQQPGQQQAERQQQEQLQREQRTRQDAEQRGRQQAERQQADRQQQQQLREQQRPQPEPQQRERQQAERQQAERQQQQEAQRQQQQQVQREQLQRAQQEQQQRAQQEQQQRAQQEQQQRAQQEQQQRERQQAERQQQQQVQREQQQRAQQEQQQRAQQEQQQRERQQAERQQQQQVQREQQQRAQQEQQQRAQQEQQQRAQQQQLQQQRAQQEQQQRAQQQQLQQQRAQQEQQQRAQAQQRQQEARPAPQQAAPSEAAPQAPQAQPREQGKGKGKDKNKDEER